MESWASCFGSVPGGFLLMRQCLHLPSSLSRLNFTERLIPSLPHVLWAGNYLWSALPMGDSRLVREGSVGFPHSSEEGVILKSGQYKLIPQGQLLLYQVSSRCWHSGTLCLLTSRLSRLWSLGGQCLFLPGCQPSCPEPYSSCPGEQEGASRVLHSPSWDYLRRRFPPNPLYLLPSNS